METRVVAAAVQLLLAVGAGVAGGAATHVAPRHRLHAGATVKAGPVGAGHRDDLAVLAVEALGTCARIVVLQVLVDGRKREDTVRPKKTCLCLICLLSLSLSIYHFLSSSIQFKKALLA